MKLSLESIVNESAWTGYNLPKYDISKVKEATVNAPVWLHFGAGNIFRAFPAVLQQTLLNIGAADKGIVVCETYDEEIIEKIFTPYDNLTVAVTLKHTAEMDKTVVGSIVHAVTLKSNRKELADFFTNPSLQMVSFTITEKGYAVKNQNGEILPFIAQDMKKGPEGAESVMGVIAAMCYLRYKAGQLPLTLMSMDNCSHNGDKLREAVTAIAGAWVDNGLAEKGFADYMNDPQKISCPLSMIDKITPRPADQVREMLQKDGLEGMELFCTAKNTYVSAFVNAEEKEYLVVEDIFPNGRPALEKAGVIFTDRETVDKVEKMKVCTCLNPLHTVLAVYGCMLGYTSISSEMNDPQLTAFIRKVSEEGMPVVVNPGIIDPQVFLDEVINIRFPNPFVPDTPQRIACDTSQKIPVRFGETLKAYIAKGDEIKNLTYIPLVFAGWLRYLTGINDEGEMFDISPDPMLPELQAQLAGVGLGAGDDAKQKAKSILSNVNLFGVDLYAHGLGEKVEDLFVEMLAEKGAVRNVLKKYFA